MLKRSFEITKEIYSDKLVLSGIEAFEGVSNMEYEAQILTIEDEDPEIIFGEFMNYLLGLYNELN